MRLSSYQVAAGLESAHKLIYAMKPTSLLALMAGFMLAQAVSAANSDSTPNSFVPNSKDLSLPESAPEREARHRKIAERRGGPIVIVHRGASALECLDHPIASRRSCLKAVLPWTEDLIQK